MKFIASELDVLVHERVEPRPKSRHVYRAVACNEFWGQGDGVSFITGITLERLTPEPDWDPIYSEISEIGIDAPIFLPEGGLIVGEVYEAVVTPFRDWETGIIDDYEINLERVENYNE